MKKFNVALPLLLLFVLVSFSCSKKDIITEKIIYQDDFSSEDGIWWYGTSDGITASLQNGKYFISYPGYSTSAFNILAGNYFTNPEAKNIAIEASIKYTKPAGAPDKQYASLIFAGIDPNQNYMQLFSTDNSSYLIWSAYEDSFTTIKDWTQDNIMRTNDFNVYRVELKNGNLHYKINGKEVFKTATTITTLDRFGFSLEHYTIMEIDYIKAIELP